MLNDEEAKLYYIQLLLNDSAWINIQRNGEDLNAIGCFSLFRSYTLMYNIIPIPYIIYARLILI